MANSTMETVSLSRDILKTPGLEKATHGIEAEPKPRYYSLSIDGLVINIESTAIRVTDALARFALEDQKKIFIVLLAKLPRSGCAIVLKEDQLCNESAYVTRRDDQLGGVVSLLFSR